MLDLIQIGNRIFSIQSQVTELILALHEDKQELQKELDIARLELHINIPEKQRRGCTGGPCKSNRSSRSSRPNQSRKA